jgi:hypothetical protein
MATHTRSSSLSAEVAAMDRIERAMAALDALDEKAQARVRRWVSETYPSPDGIAAAGNGRPASEEAKA